MVAEIETDKVIIHASLWPTMFPQSWISKSFSVFIMLLQVYNKYNAFNLNILRVGKRVTVFIAYFPSNKNAHDFIAANGVKE